MAERSGAGDPARTMALLWRSAPVPGRGPRPALSVDRVVEAATAMADEGGLDGVTMRAVAQHLGVSAMSLYTYVPGKSELLDLMVDGAYGRMSRSAPSDAHWRARLTAVADDNWALHGRHRWLITVATSRPPLGPGLLAKYEYELAAVDGLGLSDVDMDAALTFLLGFVATCARTAGETLAAATESAMTDEQWWAANEPHLARALDPGRYPLGSRVGTAAGQAQNAAYSGEHMYRFGLPRALDGLATLIDG